MFFNFLSIVLWSSQTIMLLSKLIKSASFHLWWCPLIPIFIICVRRQSLVVLLCLLKFDWVLYHGRLKMLNFTTHRITSPVYLLSPIDNIIVVFLIGKPTLRLLQLSIYHIDLLHLQVKLVYFVFDSRNHGGFKIFWELPPIIYLVDLSLDLVV